MLFCECFSQTPLFFFARLSKEGNCGNNQGIARSSLVKWMKLHFYFWQNHTFKCETRNHFLPLMLMLMYGVWVASFSTHSRLIVVSLSPWMNDVVFSRYLASRLLPILGFHFSHFLVLKHETLLTSFQSKFPLRKCMQYWMNLIQFLMCMSVHHHHHHPSRSSFDLIS